jgi:hypothetical protein
MRIVRLADLFENKYGLLSFAASPEHIINDVRRDLIDAYNNYINSDKVKQAYNILPLLAERGEPNSIDIISRMQNIYNNIMTLSVTDLFHEVNAILNIINNLSQNNHKEIRTSIHDSYVIKRDSDRQEREAAKSKFEQVVFKKLARILETQAKKLKGLGLIKKPLLGGPDETVAKELSNQEIWMFRKTPAAEKYNLDDDEVWTKVWSDPDMKFKISKLIRAIKRNHIPLDGSEVSLATAEIMEWFKQKQTNESYFESEEDKAQQALKHEILSPQEEWVRNMQEAKKEKKLLQEEEASDELEKLRLEPLIKKRDEEVIKKQLEQDRDRHVRSEGNFVLRRNLLKRYI